MTRSGTCNVIEHPREVPERTHGPAKYPEKSGDEGSEDRSVDKKSESKKPDSDDSEDEL